MLNFDCVDASKYGDLSILECGKEKCVPDKKFTYTPKRYHMFHYCLSGKGYFERNGKKYEVRRGSGFYIAPNDVPMYYPDSEDPWTYIWVGFDGLRARALLSASRISAEEPIFFDSKTSEMRDALISMYENYKLDGKAGLKCLGLLYEVFGVLTEGYKEEEKISSQQMHIHEAVEFIHNNYGFAITVKDIADSLDISPNYLANIFAKELGKSPKQYLTEYRMERAKVLLSMGEYRVKQVAQMVGYANQLHFSSEFRKFYGTSPTECKRSENAVGF